MTMSESGSVEATTFNAFIGNHLPARDGALADRERVAEAQLGERGLEVGWGDSGRSRYSSRWLRFNCFCAVCGSSNDGIRAIDLTQVPSDIHPRHMATQGNDVLLTWPDDHQSIYGGDWLRANSNSVADRARRRSWRPVTWTARPLDELPHAEFAAVGADEELRLQMCEGLRDYGLVKIDGVAADPDRTEQVAALFGPIHETTLYGYVSDVESKPVSKLGGETAIHQHPHNDDVFHYSPPGLVLFHCIANDTKYGGLSSYADGFAIAESLRDENPAAFDLLTAVPVQFIRRRPGHFDLRGEGRVIRLDENGQIAGFRYFDRSTAPLDVDEDLVDAMLDAQTEVMRRVTSSEFQVTHRLEPGDVVVVDNHRVMHGRSAFDPTSPRRIRTCTIDRDEFHARWRELAYRLGRDDCDLVLSTGAV